MKIKLPLYYFIAAYRKKRKYWPGVAENYKKLIIYAPSNIKWRITLVDALRRSKRYKQGLVEADKALQLGPYNQELIVLKLKILTKLNTKHAIDYGALMSKGLSSNTSFLVAYADVLLLEGKKTSARKKYQEALKHANSETDKIAGIYYKLATISNKKLADGYYNSALTHTTSERIKSLGLGGLHQKYGNNEAALTELLKLVDKEPENHDRWFEIGKMYSRLRQMTEARYAYSTYMRLEREQHGEGHEVDSEQVVFEAYRGSNYACSPRAIYETMIKDKKYRDYQFIWVLRGRSLRKHWRLYLHPRTRVVRYKSKDYFKAYGNSKYWITNMRLNFIEKSAANQCYVQCWHGTPFKRMGYSIEGGSSAVDGDGDERWFNDDTKQIDYFLVQSHRAATYFDDAFGLSKFGKKGMLFESGYPRNDRLINTTLHDQVRTKQTLSLPADKKILLYAPTWRDNEYDQNRGYVHDIQTDFDKLKSNLGDDWIILYRAHYLVAKGFNFDRYEGFIRDVSEVEDINDLYTVSDVLMTDYSSTFLDYANLGRPIIFYMYDLEQYQKMRGFYFDTKELPGDIVKNEDQINAILHDLEKYHHKHQVRYNKFKENYVSLDDGHAAGRVIKQIFESGK